MRRPLVMGNWKMNGRRREAQALIAAVAAEAATFPGVDVAVCPPYVYLGVAADGLSRCPAIAWGAQDVSAYGDGAYTGEISAGMARDMGCEFAIIGHSERRTLFGESDGVVAQKFARALAAGVTPVLCVGETAAERDGGHTREVVLRQIGAVFASCGTGAFDRAVIAYEPVWAIGTGRAASPDEAQAVHREIRNAVAQRNPTAAAGLRILYGGSVKAQNARELFARDDIDGGLIGGASLVAADFVGICRAACPDLA
ncbi:triose-phosphate isomerase [Acidiferrobacter sp.]|uniref:triose-phosphate isomerase n=1 Tax=Acidiferrobacter sp. TaxID=1872107 RepID=UPI00261799E8|nr:triose-phosphate isomerase [Acidiferrobacter sp.]